MYERLVPTQEQSTSFDHILTLISKADLGNFELGKPTLLTNNLDAISTFLHSFLMRLYFSIDFKNFGLKSNFIQYGNLEEFFCNSDFL